MVTLRPITSEAELLEYHRFRYRIYSESRQRSFLGDTSGIDMDAFDARAMHYGWYVDGELAGCVRFVEPDDSEKPLPMFGFLVDRAVIDAVRSYIGQRKAHGHKMVEASRFCLAPEHRGLRTAKEFVLAMVKTLQPLGYEHALFDCYVSHAPFYKLIGFELLQGAAPFRAQHSAMDSSALTCTYAKILARNPGMTEGMGFTRGRMAA